MNLRLYGGRVPLPTGDLDHPIVLVDFPTRKQFDGFFGERVKAESRDKYWAILCARIKGSTFAQVAKDFGVSRERVRQIEARFLRKVQTLHPQTKRA